MPVVRMMMMMMMMRRLRRMPLTVVHGRQKPLGAGRRRMVMNDGQEVTTAATAAHRLDTSIDNPTGCVVCLVLLLLLRLVVVLLIVAAAPHFESGGARMVEGRPGRLRQLGGLRRIVDDGARAASHVPIVRPGAGAHSSPDGGRRRRLVLLGRAAAHAHSTVA